MRLVPLSALCLALLAASGCASSHPVPGAVDLSLAPTDEELIHAAALAEVSRGMNPRDTLWVEGRTRELFDDDTAAKAWARETKAAMPRVPLELLTAYARANVEGHEIQLPSSVRGRVVARPRVASALATQRSQVFTLTRPGFTASGDSAFLIVTRVCGGSCGKNSGLLAVRDGPRWRIAATLWYELR